MGELLWTVDEMAAAMAAQRRGALPAGVAGLSIDSRTIAPGEAFFAIKGDTHDGHAFVAAALKAGGALAVAAGDRLTAMPSDAPFLVVPDVLGGLVDLARAARARSPARVVAITGSVGKTSTKEALRLALAASGETHASTASFNNHWGVPLSLARLARQARFAVFEIGMNHAGEITPLTALVRPHVAIVTTVEPVHLAHFSSVEAIADAKAEIFAGVEPGGAAVLNRDNSQFARLTAAATAAGVARIVSFGEDHAADARLIGCTLHPDHSEITADILGRPVRYRLGAPGRHLAMNSLAVLAGVALAGGDLDAGAKALARFVPAQGRGTRIHLQFADGQAMLIDESYNANPASMRAAIALLAQVPVAADGRRIAVLGDMLELGDAAADLHRGLAATIEDHNIDLVFCSGPLMADLWKALPSRRRGGYAGTASALEPQVLDAVRAGDAVMIKGSLGSRMGPIVKALMCKHAAPAQPAAQG